MTKQEKIEISSEPEQLIRSATKADWRYVREITKLNRQRIYEYRSGRSMAHKEAIEAALAKAIANRLKTEAKHKAKIARLLEAATIEINSVEIEIKGSLSKKYGQR